MHFSRRTVVLAGICFLVAGGVSTAQEWTRFRGPNGSGLSRETTIPTEWSPGDETWRVQLPGIGHSSPVLWGERLFLTSGDEESGERFLLCLDAAAGQSLWTREFTGDKSKKHQLNSFASSTPAVDAERVYFCWATPEEYLVTAVDHDGNRKWQRDLGPFRAGHGFGASPIVFGELVVIANDQQGDSSLVALDRRTGDICWQVPRDTRVTYSTPCVYERSGRAPELIFTNWKHGITAVDPTSGKTNWELPVFDEEHVETAIGSPFVAGDLIFGSCGYLGYATHTVAVRPDATAPRGAREVFRVDRGAPLTTTPLVANGLLFLWADEGIVTCVDAATGDLVWRKRVGGKYYGSPIAAGDMIYCMSADGDLVILAASKEYRQVARMSLGEGSHSTPAVANGRMYLRTFSQLICVGQVK